MSNLQLSDTALRQCQGALDAYRQVLRAPRIMKDTIKAIGDNSDE